MAASDKGGDNLVTYLAIALGIGALWWWRSSDKPKPPPLTSITQATPPPIGLTPSAQQPQPPSKPVEPIHNYNFKEGDLYGYIAAVSDEEKKTGKVAGDVLTFRYAGFWDGQYHIERVDDANRIVSVSSCAKPCVALKTWSNGQMTRVAYNPESIVGAAMQDAMDGRMKVKKAKSKVAPPPEEAMPEGIVNDAEPAQPTT